MHEIFHLYGKDAKIENFELCYAVTAVRPPLRIRTYTEVCGLKLQRLQSDPPKKTKKHSGASMQSTGRSIMSNRLQSFQKLVWEKPQDKKLFLG